MDNTKLDLVKINKSLNYAIAVVIIGLGLGTFNFWLGVICVSTANTMISYSNAWGTKYHKKALYIMVASWVLLNLVAFFGYHLQMQGVL